MFLSTYVVQKMCGCSLYHGLRVCEQKYIIVIVVAYFVFKSVQVDSSKLKVSLEQTLRNI